MKYICCIWLCIVWLVCHAQHRVVGLHIQQAPEIIQRITRQATRYGGGGGVGVGSIGGAPNYRPAPGLASNYKLRTSASEPSSSLTSSQLNAISSNPGQRNVGVGAYSFGGMASGRPSIGNSFAVNTANLSKVGNNVVIKGAIGSGAIRSQPSNQAILGSGNVVGAGAGAGGPRPQQLQQALLQAAQYQLQQHQQQQQLRRQIPQQQLYRQRPAPSTYQQYN